jgi:arsenite methyltransferase
VGPTGKVYGLDMTEEMISLANKNAKEANVKNVEFLLGSMESITLPNESVDIIISNCVINLAADKDIVLKETFRVLKSGGKFAVSDIVLRNELPIAAKKSMELWTGCIAGALLDKEYLRKLHDVGFSNASVEIVKVYTESDVF